MNRRLATKSDLADIITSGGGTFSSSSNEILTSSYANSLSSDSIGGTLTLTYSIDSTGRSSYTSNECVLYEDINFTKETGPIIEPAYYIRVTPYTFTINTEQWLYFLVESYYQDSEGVKTIIPTNVDLDGINDTSWFTIERYENNDKDLEYGYRVKATGEVSETKQATIYLKLQDENGKSDWITLTQYASEIIVHTITYKASTGVSGSNVTEEIEENTTYTPSVPNSFTLQSGYQEPMICTPSEPFVVTTDVEILVFATEIPKPKEYEFAFYEIYDVGEDDATDWIGYIGETRTIYINHTIDDYMYDIKICSRELLENDWSYVTYTYNDIPSWISISNSDGGISIGTAENNTNTERSFDIVFTQNESGKTITLHVVQIAYDGILIYDFDHLILTYNWEDTDGQDLDNATYLGYVRNDGIEVMSNPVGYGLTEFVNDLVQGKYLFYGGDNVKSGDEGAYINFRGYVDNIITPLNAKNRNIAQVICKTRSNWFERKDEGKYTLLFKAYKGGTVSKEGFKFINTDGELVKQLTSNKCSCYAVGKYNYKDPGKWYTKMYTIRYDFNSHASYISTDQTDSNGNEDYGFFYDTFKLNSWTKTLDGVITEYKDDSNYISSANWYKEFRLGSSIRFEHGSQVDANVVITGRVNNEVRYLNNPNILNNSSSIHKWSSFEVTDTGYHASMVILDNQYGYTLAIAKAGPIEIWNTYYAPDEVVAMLNLHGTRNDSDKSNYQSYSSSLIGDHDFGGTNTVKQDGYTITGRIYSVDTSKNKSIISTSNIDTGLTIEYNEIDPDTNEGYHYNINIIVSENTSSEQIMKTFTLLNEAGVTNKYYIAQRGTSFYLFSSVPFEEFNNGPHYSENINLKYSVYIADALATGNIKDFYITSFENGIVGGEIFVESSTDKPSSEHILLVRDGNHFTINIDTPNDVAYDRYAYYDVYQKNSSGDKINIRQIEIRQLHK